MRAPDRLTVTVAQLNTTVGDLAGNCDQIVAAAKQAAADGAQLLVVPEAAVCGYPAEDLLLRRQFVADTWQATLALADEVAQVDTDLTVMVGTVAPATGAAGADGDALPRAATNTLVAMRGGAVVARYDKRALPTYGVFDERRLFEAGPTLGAIVDVGGVPVGVAICEDLWVERGRLVGELASRGAQMVVTVNASPWEIGKPDRRAQLTGRAAERACVPVVYVNQVGGQDELVFDGDSHVTLPDGRRWQAPLFAADVATVTVPLQTGAGEGRTAQWKRRDDGPVEAQVWGALVLGTRDYLAKTGFDSAVVGLSGGIDSAVVATIAADAVGAGNVLGVGMPGPYSSAGSVDDARQLADNLRMRFELAPIGAMVPQVDVAVADAAGELTGTAAENVQARLRGLVLMAISNQLGSVVLTTGNRSEMAVGYATLYGDMNGGWNPLKSVPKTLVYRLARWRNTQAKRELIPASTIDKAPSAELAPDQADADSLPDYAVLDAILAAYVDDDRSPADIIGDRVADPATVERIVGLVDRNEFKRRQAAPGPKVVAKAFGRDRRLPMAQRYRHSGPARGPAHTPAPAPVQASDAPGNARDTVAALAARLRACLDAAHVTVGATSLRTPWVIADLEPVVARHRHAAAGGAFRYLLVVFAHDSGMQAQLWACDPQVRLDELCETRSHVQALALSAADLGHVTAARLSGWAEQLHRMLHTPMDTAADLAGGQR